MKKKVEDKKIRTVRMSKDKLLEAVEVMLTYFKDPYGDSVEDPVEVPNFSKRLQDWTKSSDCLPFFIKHKAVTIRKSSVDGDALKGASNIATLYKDKIIKLEKYLEEYPEKCVPICKKKIYGKRKHRRYTHIK